jgi:hypothetical protein
VVCGLAKTRVLWCFSAPLINLALVFEGQVSRTHQMNFTLVSKRDNCFIAFFDDL